jgi:hypothetical protein
MRAAQNGLSRTIASNIALSRCGIPARRPAGGSEVLEHGGSGFIVHGGFERELVFQYHSLRGGRTGGDLVVVALQVRQFGPGVIAESTIV